MINNQHVTVIGAGFAGISAAAYLAKEGYQVSVFEKNEDVGGRARQLHTSNGYVFDMGPSWYWMPDVFEKFFADFGEKPADHYQLERLDPQYAIIFGKQDILSIPDKLSDIKKMFDDIEPGAGKKLDHFLQEAAFKYQVGIDKLVYKPGFSLLEFMDKELFKGLFRLQVFTKLSAHIRSAFKDERLRSLMEFPALFLGAMAEDTPALYSLMNYAGLALGTWYPQGGFGSVITAMRSVAEANGVRFYTGEAVTGFGFDKKHITKVITTKGEYSTDAVIGAADYNHIEQELLPQGYRQYNAKYWDKRVMAPSALIFYIGVTSKVTKLLHHNLFFDEPIDIHAKEIYRDPQWPSKPLFYVCCPSKTDNSVAPEGHENIFILMPLATGLKDTEELRQRYYHIIMDRLEAYCGEVIRDRIDQLQSYCVNDFKADYHSFGGNAYGLANTLSQTAILKPSMRNKHLDNLFFAGQLTVPGPGVPPAIISGKVAATQTIKQLTKNL